MSWDFTLKEVIFFYMGAWGVLLVGTRNNGRGSAIVIGAPIG